MIPASISGARRAFVTAVSTGALIVGVTAACQESDAEFSRPIDDSTYVVVMGELADVHRFPPDGDDQEARDALSDSVRQAILDRHGVSADDMLAYAEAAGAHPAHMEEISKQIVALADSLAEARRGPEADDSMPEDLSAAASASRDSGASRDSLVQRAPRAVPFDSTALRRLRREHPIDLDLDPTSDAGPDSNPDSNSGSKP